MYELCNNNNIQVKSMFRFSFSPKCSTSKITYRLSITDRLVDDACPPTSVDFLKDQLLLETKRIQRVRHLWAFQALCSVNWACMGGGWALHGWKVYSLKKVLKCRGNSFVDIDNSKWVVKVQGMECQPKTKPVGMTCGLPLYHSQNWWESISTCEFLKEAFVKDWKLLLLTSI